MRLWSHWAVFLNNSSSFRNPDQLQHPGHLDVISASSLSSPSAVQQPLDPPALPALPLVASFSFHSHCSSVGPCLPLSTPCASNTLFSIKSFQNPMFLCIYGLSTPYSMKVLYNFSIPFLGLIPTSTFQSTLTIFLLDHKLYCSSYSHLFTYLTQSLDCQLLEGRSGVNLYSLWTYFLNGLICKNICFKKLCILNLPYLFQGKKWTWLW